LLWENPNYPTNQNSYTDNAPAVGKGKWLLCSLLMQGLRQGIWL